MIVVWPSYETLWSFTNGGDYISVSTCELIIIANHWIIRIICLRQRDVSIGSHWVGPLMSKASHCERWSADNLALTARRKVFKARLIFIQHCPTDWSDEHGINYCKTCFKCEYEINASFATLVEVVLNNGCNHFVVLLNVQLAWLDVLTSDQFGRV